MRDFQRLILLRQARIFTGMLEAAGQTFMAGSVKVIEQLLLRMGPANAAMRGETEATPDPSPLPNIGSPYPGIEGCFPPLRSEPKEEPDDVDLCEGGLNVPDDPAVPSVELRPSYLWDCDQCGRENLARPSIWEGTKEQRDELERKMGFPRGEGTVYRSPSKVSCKHCGAVYAARYIIN